MTGAELAILDLVVEQPRHGYEIERVIETRGMRDWTDVGFSSIYHILGKLATSGLIRGRREPAAGRGPARKVYRVTDAGRKAWREATLEVLSQPARQPSSLLQGLANLAHPAPAGIPADEAIAALTGYRARLEERLGHVQAQRRRSGDAAFFVNAMFEYGETMLEAEAGWVARLIQRLDAQREP